MLFLNGYLLGLGMIIFIGPVFFQLVSVSIKSGVIPGLVTALGIFLSDIFCVLLCWYGINTFIISSEMKFIFSIAGSIILLLLGVKTFITKNGNLKQDEKTSSKSLIESFTKGFLVNFVNPFVFFVWIGVTAFSKTEYNSVSKEFTYLSGVLLAILTLDVSKVFLAKKIGDLVKSESHVWIYRICGIFLIGFSIRMLFDAIR